MVIPGDGGGELGCSGGEGRPGPQSPRRPGAQCPSGGGRSVPPSAGGEGTAVARCSSGVAGADGGIVRVAVTVALGRRALTGSTGGREVLSTSGGGVAPSSGITTGRAGGGSAVRSMRAAPVPAAT
ncbi:hypothetical protein DI270_009505, partial [Microbispora triticiradicis]